MDREAEVEGIEPASRNRVGCKQTGIAESGNQAASATLCIREEKQIAYD